MPVARWVGEIECFLRLQSIFLQNRYLHDEAFGYQPETPGKCLGRRKGHWWICQVSSCIIDNLTVTGSWTMEQIFGIAATAALKISRSRSIFYRSRYSVGYLYERMFNLWPQYTLIAAVGDTRNMQLRRLRLFIPFHFCQNENLVNALKPWTISLH